MTVDGYGRRGLRPHRGLRVKGSGSVRDAEPEATGGVVDDPPVVGEEILLGETGPEEFLVAHRPGQALGFDVHRYDGTNAQLIVDLLMEEGDAVVMLPDSPVIMRASALDEIRRGTP